MASLVDLALGAVLAGLLASTTGEYFARRAVVALHIGEPGTAWTGVVPMLLGVASPLSYGFAFAWLMVLLADAVAGATPGKLLTGLAIVSTDGDAPCTLRACWIRTLVKTAPLWMFCLALVAGSWTGVRVAMGGAVATAAGLAWAAIGGRAATGERTAIGGRAAIHDRVAGTRVSSRPAGRRPA